MTAVASEKVWSAKPGSRIPEETAVRVGEFLDAHFPDEGELVEPAAFVREAKDSEIHDLLEWNTKRAAEKYRLVQAEHILRSVTYTIKTNGDETGPTRAMLHVVLVDEEGNDRSGYMRAEVVWRTPGLREQQLEVAARELAAFTRKFQEFSEIVAAIQEYVLPLLEEEMRDEKS